MDATLEKDLALELSGLAISNKTGVIYDPEMLLHNSGKKNHPECPSRLTSIIENLKLSGVLARSIEINKLEPGKHEDLAMVYGESYIQYVRNLYSDAQASCLSQPGAACSEDKVFWYADTYYNKHTSHAAELAVGAMTRALDEIFSGRIDNCFACVRPPGHHSGFNGSINGFCVYNNVAIVAKIAKEKYGVKRVLIVDWDVHHGDGTQEIFYSDDSLLYSSFHRYDKGSFYPGRSGDPSNTGENQGKGYNINIGWNLISEDDIVGDNEYVYCYERVLHPVFEAFDPELVIISAGFDSARGDPLGCLDVTVDGYAYITKRLQSLAKGKVLVVLEGGYNLKSIAKCAEGVVRVLQGEDIPVKNSENKLNLQQMRAAASPNEFGLESAKATLSCIEQFWPVLKENKELAALDEALLKKKEGKKKSNISGGHQDAIFVKEEKLYKQAKTKELNFYQSLHSNDSLAFKEFRLLSPTFFGVEVIEEKKYLVMGNLLHELPFASLMDIKLGKETFTENSNRKKVLRETEKNRKTTTLELGFRVTGLVVKDKNGAITRKATKHECYFNVTKENIVDRIREVFKSNESKDVNAEALKYVQDFVEKCICFFEKFNPFWLRNSSLLFAVDNNLNKFDCKLIDFNHHGKLAEGEHDGIMIDALRSLKKTLAQV